MQLGQPLAQIDFSEESREQAFTSDKAIGSDELAALLREAEATLARVGEAADQGVELNTYRLTLPASVNALRWFALPQEVSAHLFGESENKGEAAA
jgi:multidrug efflux pump subunit AcrA (membrane-fusion protein)